MNATPTTKSEIGINLGENSFQVFTTRFRCIIYFSRQIS
jgi:hypothetical protein